MRGAILTYMSYFVVPRNMTLPVLSFFAGKVVKISIVLFSFSFSGWVWGVCGASRNKVWVTFVVCGEGGGRLLLAEAVVASSEATVLAGVATRP